MKRTILLVFALASLAFTGCKKEQPEPVPTIDNRLLGEWLFTQVDHPNGHISMVLDVWEFGDDNTITTPDTVLNYTANNYEIVINKSDTFRYSFPSEEMNMLDTKGNNLRFRRQ